MYSKRVWNHLHYLHIDCPPWAISSMNEAVWSPKKLSLPLHMVLTRFANAGSLILWIGSNLDETRRNMFFALRQNKNHKARLSRIQETFSQPEYLNTNQALHDIGFLIFEAYRPIFFKEDEDENLIENTKKSLFSLGIYLRRLSNQSWLVKIRSSGQTAFTHWMEAIFIYIHSDPSPTIDWLRRVAAHDALEDPLFQDENDTIWSKKVTIQRLQKFVGSDNLELVKRFHTKPAPSPEHLPQDERRMWDGLTFFPNKQPAQKEILHMARNRRHTERINKYHPDIYFLEKMADAISNLRSMDAFSLDNTSDEGRKKIHRKCAEAIQYYLPRVVKLWDAYTCQMIFELKSLNEKYWLGFTLLPIYDSIFEEAKNRLIMSGYELIVYPTRIINSQTELSTERETLGIIRALPRKRKYS